MSNTVAHNFATMPRDQLIDFCYELYRSEGISALSYESLEKRGALYYWLYQRNLGQKVLLKELGLEEEYRKYKITVPIRRNGKDTLRWSWERVLAVAREVAEREGRLPVAAWMQANGYGSLVSSIYNLGHTWAALRGALKDFSNSNFVESRNGLRWLSHAEASLSNYLYARGIEHRKGGRYPDAYSELSGRSYGIFDLSFLATNGQWIDVEVWGDNPKGHGKEDYSAKRAFKEEFNKTNSNFLGIGHQDCYDEDRLSEVLDLYIGRIEPFRFDKPTDALIHTTHWSNADELLEYARHLAATMPDGVFPTEGWLRKRGKWVDRPGEPYNTLSIYIKKWLGGVRKLRMLLNQEDASTTQWTREKAIQAYKEFHDKNGITPSNARHRYKKHGDITAEIYLEASRIEMAVLKYAGGSEAVREGLEIGLTKNWKWSPEKVVEETKSVITKYGLSPNQLLNDHRKELVVLTDDERRNLGQLIDAGSRHTGGLAAVLKELGYERIPRPRKKRVARPGKRQG